MKLRGEQFTNSDTCHGVAFAAEAPLDFAEITITGRYPEQGWAKNFVSHEMVRVLRGEGSLEFRDRDNILLAESDVVHIPPRTWFAWSGDMTIFTSCSPPFSAEQYEISEEGMEKEQVPKFDIRTATVDDTEAIRRMHAASWLATYPNDEHGVSAEWVEEYTGTWFTDEAIEQSKRYVQRAIDDVGGFYRVTESGGEIVGFVHATTNGDGSKELQAIYTRPDMFGSGLGHELMQHAIEWMGEAPADLEVAVYNQRAIRFYEKYGFKKIEGTEYLYRGKIPVVKMAREDSYEI